MSKRYVSPLLWALSAAGMFVSFGCASNVGLLQNANTITAGSIPTVRTNPIRLDSAPPAIPAEIGDVGDLNFEVVKADIEKYVDSNEGTDHTTLDAKDGYKLVVPAQDQLPARCVGRTRAESARKKRFHL